MVAPTSSLSSSDRLRFPPPATAAVALVGPVSRGDDVFVPFDDLAANGIPIGRRQLRRLIRDGYFPAPCQISPNRIAWRLSEVRLWKETRPVAASAARGLPIA
jgi:predicted DNA-binding transcriptional regulator AlpA